MRADRLLSLLMLLQTRGTTSARVLAELLEVTERTIYRDVTALSAAGVPIYTERGSNGGIALLEEYRTSLTALNPGEVRALFMLNIPASLNQLGVGAELRTALLKLSAALPNSRRAEELAARQKIHIDPQDWTQSAEPAPHLGTIQSALWDEHWLEIIYRSDFGAAIPLRLTPYGLVARGNTWYLIGAVQDHIRVLRISQIQQATISAETFTRSAGFDLASFWAHWLETEKQHQTGYVVIARVSPQLAAMLDREAPAIPSPGTNQNEHWQTKTLTFDSFEDARTRILGYGGAIEVIFPLPLRHSVLDFAEQIRTRYHSPIP